MEFGRFFMLWGVENFGECGIIGIYCTLGYYHSKIRKVNYPMKKLFFIMNPHAGQKKANKVLAEIFDIFNRADYEVTAYMTAAPGDGIDVVCRHAKDADLIVCCGGDGTFNETISGILKSGCDVPVGYIPAGSTNDFAASLKLSTNILQAARDIVEGAPQRFDVGSFGGRNFSYVSSFGIFTKSSYATPQSVKNALGHLAYVLSGITEIASIRTHKLRFTLPDGRVIEDKFIFGAVSNSTSVGGVLTLAPSIVDLADGKFELLLIRAPKNLAELTECVVALQKQTYNCKMLTLEAVDKVTITTEEQLDWTLDGECEHGKPEVEVQCLHHAVQIVRRAEA